MKKYNSTFSNLLQEQRDYVDGEILVQRFMETYQKDLENIANGKHTSQYQSHFHVFMSKAILSYYNLDSKDPQQIWQSISSLVEDIPYGTYGLKRKKYIGLTDGSIYSYIDFVNKEKKLSVLDMMDYVDRGDFGGSMCLEDLIKEHL